MAEISIRKLPRCADTHIHKDFINTQILGAGEGHIQREGLEANTSRWQKWLFLENGHMGNFST